ncbi:MAG: D-alanyl-D-alanine carboxypeptidase [Oscillospiraceae bacterium]|nr:D-alanyl-D-alanine carboxypeptidase [Oscillospiraceae bacterium]
MKKMALVILVFALLAGSVSAAEPEIKGKSAILMDAATGTILCEQNIHQALAPASVTKVMTMLLIMEAIDDGRIGWEDTVTASEAAAAKGGSQVYLKVGETMTVADMVKSIAVSSANDCACAMAEHIAGSEAAFVERMNARAAELGMHDTHFVNCTGLDDDASAKDHKTSAHDIAIMSRELLVNHPDIRKYTTIWMDTIREGAFGLSNTNKMVRYYPGCTGLKTGFTAAAGYCLSASAERDGMELIAVVMGAETSQDRFSTCKSLLDHGFANYALYEPVVQEGASVPVTLGKADSVAAMPENDTRLLVEKAMKNSITAEVTLEASAEAPVAQGQRLGTLTVRAGDEILAEVPLVAQSAVEKLSFGDLMGRVLRKVAMAK